MPLILLFTLVISLGLLTGAASVISFSLWFGVHQNLEF
jgi:hypothetical protein